MKKGKWKTRLLSWILCFLMIVTSVPLNVFASNTETDGTLPTTETTTPAPDAKVYLTVSNQGVLATAADGSAMAHREVTVKDINSDGKLTFDEALIAAHATYNSADGYAAAYGYVSKLWGVDTANTLFFINNVGLETSVSVDTVKENDELVASINSDNTYYSDWYTFFDTPTKSVTAGKTFTLTLKGHLGMAYMEEDKKDIAISGVSVGTWNNGTFTALDEKTTDAEGKVTLSFDQAGTYYVTASGTVSDTVTDYTGTPDENWVYPTITHDCPIIAPVCVVTVTEQPRLASLEVGTYSLTPEFNPMVTEYTSVIPDYLSSVSVKSTLADAYKDNKKICYYTYNSMFGGFGWTSSSSINTSKGYFGVVIYDKSGSMTNEDIRYTVNFNKYATLKNLTVDGTADLAFQRDTTDGYHYYVDSTKDGVDITATGYKGNYTINIGGNTVTSGETFHLTYHWNDAGKMEVPITVSGTDLTENTYTIILEKEPLNDEPYMVVQPERADYIIGDTAKAMSVRASANGTLNYQWYKNSTNSIDGATAIEGANQASYTPEIESVGTNYYFCRITNTEKTVYTDSAIVDVVVDPDPTPVVTLTTTGGTLPTDDGYSYKDTVGYVYNMGDTATPLTVTYTTKAEGEITYSWYVKNKYSTYGTEATLTPDTAKATPEGYWYYCRVTNKFKGKTYTANSDAVYVYVKATEAAIPVVSQQPTVDKEYLTGQTPNQLSFYVSSPDGGTLSYQWYSNTEKSENGAIPVEGATNRTFTPPTSDKAGTVYYFCRITNTMQKFSNSTITDIVAINFKSADDIIAGTWNGSGTQEDPYLLEDAEDFVQISSFVATDGIPFTDKYFKVTADITLPDTWNGIGGGSTSGNGKNLLPFSGTIDGDGHTITFAKGSVPLFKYVREATVKNLNIYGEYINGYGLVANYVVDYGMDGNYSTGCPATINIDNVTIKSGTTIKNSGFIGGYASGVNTVTITNCTAEAGVRIGYNVEKDAPAGVSRIGSFAGDFNGTISGCHSAATVYGKDYVGGIVGGKGQTMGPYAIRNCSFTGEIIATGKFVGGIAGGGYSGSMWGVDSAPNSPCATIENCFSTATITGADRVGGILGGEEGVTQNWGNAYIRNNCFAGTLTATADGGDTGNIVGYMKSLNGKHVIESNYYPEGNDAKWFGAVSYVDTNCAEHENASGATYFDTSKNLAEQELPSGVSKTNHNRTDNPLGVDATNLGTPMTAEQFADGTVTDLLNASESSLHNWVQSEEYPTLSNDAIAYKLEISGEYKKDYTIGDELDLTGVIFKATWSDGKVTNPTLDDVTVTGFDNHKHGEQTLTITYGAATAEIVVTVLKPAGTISVTFSLLGDDVHDSEADGEIHTLAAGNLTTWVSAKEYTVDTNATVKDVLEVVLVENNMTCSNPSGNYVESITRNGVTLAEFTNGANSGWMYTLNGVHSDLGISQQYLQNGDVIVFHYTDDYTKESNSTATDIPPVDVSATADEVAVKVCKETGDYLEKLAQNTTPTVGSIGGEWLVLGLTRSGRAVPDGYYDNVVNYVKENINDKGQLHRAKSTDNSRIILALTSAGYDPREVGGYNLLTGLTDMDYVTKQGINGPIWALIALDSHNYEVQGESVVENVSHMALQTLNSYRREVTGQVTRSKLIDYILDAQLDDGGWALSGDVSDSDMTGMALQALAPYYKTNEEVKIAVDRALIALSDMQEESGAYATMGTVTSESMAQVVVALTALGINPDTDARFVKNGNSVLDALMAYAVDGGGFKHVADGEVDGMATEQGYYALVAYERFVNGQNGLYDMSDVTIKVATNETNVNISEPDNSNVNNSDKVNSALNNAEANKTENNQMEANVQNNPKTGDENNIALYGTILAVSLIVAQYCRYNMKKRRKR